MFRHSHRGAFAAFSPKDLRHPKNYSLISIVFAVVVGLILPSYAASFASPVVRVPSVVRRSVGDAAKGIKEVTFCSSGFAIHVNLDCYPAVVHVLSAEKGVLAGGANAISCNATDGRQLQPIKSPVCQNLAAPVCNNAYPLPRGNFVRVRYQVITSVVY